MRTESIGNYTVYNTKCYEKKINYKSYPKYLNELYYKLDYFTNQSLKIHPTNSKV